MAAIPDTLVSEHPWLLYPYTGKMLYIVEKFPQHGAPVVWDMKLHIMHSGILSGMSYVALKESEKTWTLHFEGDVPDIQLMTDSSSETYFGKFWYYVHGSEMIDTGLVSSCG